MLSVGKPEGKRPLSRPKRRWEDNIKVGIQEVEWGSNELSGFIVCGELLD
jgi:hypothetical protein